MSKRVAIIASHGGIETAFKAINIALAGTATDAEVQIFFTFEGLDILQKDAAERLTSDNQRLMEGLQNSNVPPITEMIQLAQESGVQFIACQMSMDVLGLKKDDMIDGVTVAGAMTFLDFAYDADVTVTF